MLEWKNFYYEQSYRQAASVLSQVMLNLGM